MRSAWHSGGSGVARSDNGGADRVGQKHGGILQIYMADSPASMSVPRRGDGLPQGPIPA